MIAPLISPVDKYRQAASSATKLPEHAVSTVKLEQLADRRHEKRGDVPWTLDVQEIADSVAQDCTANAKCNIRSSVFRISSLHVCVIFCSSVKAAVHPCKSYQRHKSPQSSPLAVRSKFQVKHLHSPSTHTRLQVAVVAEDPWH